ncbi:MAG: ribonuclease HII [Candidatus Merdivicinus sp.]|jgi:ribonuclease HII
MTLSEYDRSLGIAQFCGVDEAGRGPLAGDVYAAAVILSPEIEIPGLNDSKKLTEKKREALFPLIQEKAEAWSIASASVEEIDRLNILQATFLAMRRAVEGLSVKPTFALIDGNRNPQVSVPSRCLIKGDATSASIAAASILAKVARDHSMKELAEAYPEYAFEKHKGYGTKEHYACLDAYGASPVHRMSFLKKYFAEKGETPSLRHGMTGEAAAANFLAQEGYLLLMQNYRCLGGEIDLIAEKDGFLAFCEVKARQTNDSQLNVPAEAVTLAKQRRLIRAAMCYIQEHPSELQPRFDVIEVRLSPCSGTVEAVSHLPGAFALDERNGGREYAAF